MLVKLIQHSTLTMLETSSFACLITLTSQHDKLYCWDTCSIASCCCCSSFSKKRTLIPWLHPKTSKFSTLTAQNCEQMLLWITCCGAVCGWKLYFFYFFFMPELKEICLYSIQTWLPQKIHTDIPLSMDNSTLDMWFTSKISQKSSQLNRIINYLIVS